MGVFGAADLLAGPPTGVNVPAAFIPLVGDLTSFSHGFDAKADPSPFRNTTLYFSITRGSIGLPGSVVNAEALGNGAAGDIFGLFVSPLGPVALMIDAGPGGLGLAVLPAFESNVDAIDYVLNYWPDPAGNRARPLFYAIGSTILYQPYGIVPPVVYATAPNLGLVAGDVIDALAVWSTEFGGQLGQDDRILISLAPGSPSLATIPQASAASVIQAFPGGAFVRVPAQDLGLNDNTDDVDAITLVDPGDGRSLSVPRSGPSGDLQIERVFPNPSNGEKASVTFALPNPGAVRIEIIDVNGRTLGANDMGTLSAGRHTIDMSMQARLPASVYFLRVHDGTTTRTTRLAVMR